MKQLDYVLNNEIEILTFLKSKYPLFHLSNVFFRDIQYGVMILLERKKMPVGYSAAEKIAKAFAEQLEKKKTFTPIDKQSWVLNYPQFKAVAAKPAAKPAAPAAAKPAAVGARPGLPPLNRPPVAVKPTVAVPVAEAAPVAAEAPAPQPAKVAEAPAKKPLAVPTGKTLPLLDKKALPPIVGRTPVGPKK